MKLRAARKGLSCFAAVLLVTGCAPAEDPRWVAIEGRIESGSYQSPQGLFRVAVPEMRNPFVKRPSAISDRRRSEHAEEVDFSVVDLGEAHRYGVRPLGDGADLEGIFDEELGRWTRRWVDTSGRAERILEVPVQLADGAGLARVYLVADASLLFSRQGEGAPVRESALIGVVVVPLPQRGRALYAVSQFDMPNRGGHFTLETQKGRVHLAEEHVHRMRQLTATLRLQ